MVLLEFSMTPSGHGESVSPYVAKSLKVIEASGLDYRLHAMGTVIEENGTKCSQSFVNATKPCQPTATA